MFCQRCGSQLSESAQFCSSCGQAMSSASFPPPASAAAATPLASSVRVLGILWAIYSGFRILSAVWIVVFGHFFFPLFSNLVPHDAAPVSFLPFIHAIFILSAVYSAITGALGVWAAWSLLKREPNGRILALGVAFIALISIPLGTALGVYTLIVLLPEGAAEGYRRLGAPQA